MGGGGGRGEGGTCIMALGGWKPLFTVPPIGPLLVIIILRLGAL